MQSHATAPTQEDEEIPLEFTKEDYETLKDIFEHLGTISFNGTTIPSPLVLALKAKPGIDITAARELLNILIMARQVQECKDEIKDLFMHITKSEHELLTNLIRDITELSIKYHNNIAQLIEIPINIIAVSALFIKLSEATLFAHKETLLQKTLPHIQNKTKPEIEALCNATNKITSEVDDKLTIALTINQKIASQFTDENKDILLKLFGFGYSFYGVLERIKVDLVNAKKYMRLDGKFSASHFLDKLTENPRLAFNPTLELTALYSRYQHLQLHTNNIKNIDKAYEYAKSRLNKHYENRVINKADFHYFTYGLSLTRLPAVFERCNDNVKKNEQDSARKHLLEIEELLSLISLSDNNPLKSTIIDHQLFDSFLTLTLKSLNKRGLSTTASTINGLVSDIQLVKRILNSYKNNPIKPPNSDLPFEEYDKTITLFDRTISLMEKNANSQKQAILDAEANARKLSEEVNDKLIKYDEDFEKILYDLTNGFEAEIKDKPKVKAKPKIKPAIATPKASTHEAMPEQQTRDPDRGMPDHEKKNLAAQAAEFFESINYRNYREFVNQQTPEDHAEALLYAADYCLLAKNIDTAVQLFEESYTLAKEEDPLNDDLIANLKLSLTITHLHIEKRLAQTKASEDRLNQSRLQCIMCLGYECAANTPQTVSTSSPRKNQEEYHKYIHELGLACFKNIGIEKQALNIPLSKYSARREFIEREMKRLTKSNVSTERLLDIIEGKPASALLQHSHFKPKQTTSLPSPSKKKAPSANRRTNKRK